MEAAVFRLERAGQYPPLAWIRQSASIWMQRAGEQLAKCAAGCLALYSAAVQWRLYSALYRGHCSRDPAECCTLQCKYTLEINIITQTVCDSLHNAEMQAIIISNNILDLSPVGYYELIIRCSFNP